MGFLKDFEWEMINKIILMIHCEDDSRKMRKRLLEELRHLVVYDIGEFSLGNDDYSFYDSVEVNMDTGEIINILEKYYEYKDKHGNINIDWIFRSPNSVIVRDRDILRGGAFDESKLNKFFIEKLNMKYLCTTSLAVEGIFVGELTIYRTDLYEIFSDRDIYILEQLKDHLANRLLKQKQTKNTRKLEEGQYARLVNSNLTEREIEVFELAFWGFSNDYIAKKLFISENTVKKHLVNIYGKLEIKTRTQLKILLTNL